jgi:hypothetical protein
MNNLRQYACRIACWQEGNPQTRTRTCTWACACGRMGIRKPVHAHVHGHVHVAGWESANPYTHMCMVMCMWQDGNPQTSRSRGCRRGRRAANTGWHISWWPTALLGGVPFGGIKRGHSLFCVMAMRGGAAGLVSSAIAAGLAGWQRGCTSRPTLVSASMSTLAAESREGPRRSA